MPPSTAKNSVLPFVSNEKMDVVIDELQQKGLLKESGDYIYIPEDKIYVMNEIINIIM